MTYHAVEWERRVEPGAALQPWALAALALVLAAIACLRLRLRR
jgi:hypothetical protein